MNEAKAIVMQVLLLAGIMLATVVGKSASAAEHGFAAAPAGAGFQGNHTGGSIIPPSPSAPALPPPVFNQSNPYSVPQSSERPVSPASPGSVFGDH